MIQPFIITITIYKITNYIDNCFLCMAHIAVCYKTFILVFIYHNVSKQFTNDKMRCSFVHHS